MFERSAFECSDHGRRQQVQRDHDVAAVAHGFYPRGPVHVAAKDVFDAVTFPVDLDLAGINADAHT